MVGNNSNPMLELVRAMPEHLLAGYDIGCGQQPGRADDALVITGMGGSAISGALLAGVAADSSPVPILCSRDYDLPAAVGRRSLVIAISYSGNTEETLSGFNVARKRGCRLAVITSGGRLAAEAARARIPVVIVPTGLPPRAALGFLFGSLLALARSARVLRLTRKTVIAASTLLATRYETWRRKAGRLARALGDNLPVVYATSRLSEPVAERWRCQINENAKLLCHSSILPEHNHNEIVGMGAPYAMRSSHLFTLVDDSTHSRTRLRLKHLLGITRGTYRKATILAAEGESRLEQALSLVLLGDLLSIELAASREVDPLPVTRIEELKRRMARN
ncbi:MAG TPA: bifunctional phosphoglucose/phosphomannose isomerase [candidate division WOR-3 bacterium]|uniref:Bifunctional phosphoglucose/phosphomannose isomerase n=1 Tax=candidate division WOR-3 bacterium TaxID=2052148 RepID=A0A7V0XFN8_UNCW3|nr:bifunctional phosphoglucose/phosphomannose isomerase [candidate division WOR-3 bacterium]